MQTRPHDRSRWTRRLWLVTCLLFLMAGWRWPDKRASYLSVAVVFGIIGARQRAGSTP
jgi:hypothetical protein